MADPELEKTLGDLKKDLEAARAELAALKTSGDGSTKELAAARARIAELEKELAALKAPPPEPEPKPETKKPKNWAPWATD